MNKLNVLKCNKCNAVCYAIKDCRCDDCGIMCCGEKMQALRANTVDASAEKHVPKYERVEDEIYVTVPHPMEKTHYIEWIACVNGENVQFSKLFPEQDATARFKYMPNSTIFAYCNKHELWSSDVK